MVLMALTLALSAACRADASAPTPAVPEPSSETANEPRGGIRRPPAHATVGQRINETVRRLTRSLDLNPEQQAKLRQILLDQRQQTLRLRSQSLEPGADRVGMNLAILDRTKERIRAMLSEEQRKKYTTDVPRDQTAPAQADLQHWMEIQESNRRKGKDESK